MSSSDGKWQLGVAHVAERFDSFNRWTKLGEDYAAMPTAASTTGISAHENYDATTGMTAVLLDNSISTDYTESPFFLVGNLAGIGTDYIYGSEVVLGPSSDANYDGSVERARLRAVALSGSNYTKMIFNRVASQYHMAWPSSAYISGDPVLIRSMPHGWSTYSDFSSLKMIVRPIERYDTLQALTKLENPAGGSGFPDYTNRERRSGVELCVTEIYNVSVAMPRTNRYIQFISDVNTFIPHIRKWRISWDYRLCRANYNAIRNPEQFYARILIALATADGSFLFPIKSAGAAETENAPASDLDGDGISDVHRPVKTYSTIRDNWTNDSAIASYIKSEAETGFYFIADENPPAFSSFHRGNRWVVRAYLTQGVNTAFGIDNVVIEHAHGTSDEANGYYEIDDWPDQTTISFYEISRERPSTRLEDGSLKVGYRDTIPRWGINADFINVDVSIYRDMLILLDWQKAGYPLILRPFNTPLPSPLIGKMNIDRWRTQHWDVTNRVSFTLSFEEI